MKRLLSCLPARSLTLALALSTSASGMVSDVFADEPASPAVPAKASRLPSPKPRTRQDEGRYRGLSPEELLQNRSHDVILDDKGSFSGRLFSVTQDGLVPAAGMKVSVLRAGASIGETSTDETGKFTVSGMPKGVLAIIATTDSTMAIYGVRALEATEQNPATREIDIESAIVDSSNFEVSRAIISEGIGARDLRFSGPVRADEENFPYANGNPATPISYDSVQIAADGKVYGQINLLDERTGRVREVLSMRVYFVKEGKVAAAGRVASNGAFALGGLEPGIHSMVGVGRDGVFAIGIEVLPFKAAGKQEDAVPVRLMVNMEVAVAPVTAQNLNTGNVSNYLGEAGAAPTAPVAPATPPAGAAAAAAPAGGGGAGAAGAGAAGGAAAGLGGALAGGAAGALAGAVLSDDSPASAGTGN
jgi:hypothetical protein